MTCAGDGESNLTARGRLSFRTRLLIVVSTAVTACILLGLWRLAEAPKVTEARITIYDLPQNSKIPSGTSLVIRDDKILGELMSYIKRAGRTRLSFLSGGWTTSIEIVLVIEGGERITVNISDDLTEYSDNTGLGDGNVEPGLEVFISELATE